MNDLNGICMRSNETVAETFRNSFLLGKRRPYQRLASNALSLGLQQNMQSMHHEATRKLSRQPHKSPPVTFTWVTKRPNDSMRQKHPAWIRSRFVASLSTMSLLSRDCWILDLFHRGSAWLRILGSQDRDFGSPSNASRSCCGARPQTWPSEVWIQKMKKHQVAGLTEKIKWWCYNITIIRIIAISSIWKLALTSTFLSSRLLTSTRWLRWWIGCNSDAFPPFMEWKPLWQLEVDGQLGISNFVLQNPGLQIPTLHRSVLK